MIDLFMFLFMMTLACSGIAYKILENYFELTQGEYEEVNIIQIFYYKI
jgi:hypothetical protein